MVPCVYNCMEKHCKFKRSISICPPRMYIHLILNCKEGEFSTLWGVVCSSWVRINCFTSQRSLLLPEGDVGKSYIERANQMFSRLLVNHVWWLLIKSIELLYFHFVDVRMHVLICVLTWVPLQLRAVLLLYLVVACGGSFLLEQPGSSIMGEYIRMQEFCRIVQVTRLELMWSDVALNGEMFPCYHAWLGSLNIHQALCRTCHGIIIYEFVYALQYWFDMQFDITMHQRPSCPHMLPVSNNDCPWQVYTFTWFMGHYGSQTPKPQRGWTNNKHYARLSKGPMNMRTFPSQIKTVKKTISKSGKKSWSGTKDLKSTQIHVYLQI